ncbi:TRAP transporter substrate-binding protein [Virgibacillus sp. W0181]|uniref:TRAP transporter substrate-binding protein n=1 Tax=Virgibacillus sp. W0181 TaxID=3391581 RepID=UPI003F446715
MKKRLVFLFGITAFVLAFATACGGNDNANEGSSDSSGETHEWRIGFNTVEGSVKDVAAKKFKEVVEAESDGNITVEIFPGESLGNEQEMLESIQAGALEMQIVGSSLVANTIPEYGLMGLPFLVNDFDEAYAILDGELGQKWADMGEDHGFKVIGTTDLGGFAQITNNVRPINKPEDLKDISMRAPNDVILMETFEALGSQVSQLPYSELYLALSQGVVDGQFNPKDAIYQTKFHEVQDYLANVNIAFYTSKFIMNLDMFNELDEETQELVLKAGEEAEAASREYTIEESLEMDELLEDEFVEITNPDPQPFRDKMDPVYDIAREQTSPEAVDELLEFLEEYRANNE